ncbi:MAG: type II toxin-antitoxin system HicA family toxin [Planctomycetia bacterium]|nr:type II toxin-antitoxin system HicA family toxin [Planctomycetia bacterium]
MPATIRELIRRIQKDGWFQVRQTGSYSQFHLPTKPGTVTIAGKESMEVALKTERSILRQAGLQWSNGDAHEKICHPTRTNVYGLFRFGARSSGVHLRCGNTRGNH